MKEYGFILEFESILLEFGIFLLMSFLVQVWHLKRDPWKTIDCGDDQLSTRLSVDFGETSPVFVNVSLYLAQKMKCTKNYQFVERLVSSLNAG